MQFNNTLNRFRSIAILEGVSFLLLLFIAMPLKYFLGMPFAVKYIGWAHGLLFIIYMILLLQCAGVYNWSLKRNAWAFIAAFLPFATFILDRQLAKEYPQGGETRE